jgi:hypothetical protein
MFYEELQRSVLRPVIFNSSVFRDNIAFLEIALRDANPVAAGFPQLFSLPQRSLNHLHVH